MNIYMREIMSCIRSTVSIFSIVLSIYFLSSCTDSFDKSPVAPVKEVGDDINKVSSKTIGVEILGGTVKSTNASICIRFTKKIDSDVLIRLGISDTTYFFEESLKKHPNNFIPDKKNLYTFYGLKPKTKYYIWIIRILDSDSGSIQTYFKTLSKY